MYPSSDGPLLTNSTLISEVVTYNQSVKYRIPIYSLYEPRQFQLLFGSDPSSILCSINCRQEDLNTTVIIRIGRGLKSNRVKQYFKSSDLVEGTSQLTGSTVPCSLDPFTGRSMFSLMPPVVVTGEVVVYQLIPIHF